MLATRRYDLAVFQHGMEIRAALFAFDDARGRSARRVVEENVAGRGRRREVLRRSSELVQPRESDAQGPFNTLVVQLLGFHHLYVTRLALPFLFIIKHILF